MKKKKLKEKEYYGGRIKRLVEDVARFSAEHPDIILDCVFRKDFGRLHIAVAATHEGYGKKEECYNCNRSMYITNYTADLHDALLILAMAKQVRKNLAEGVAPMFTDANKVHIPTLPDANYSTLKRTTKCDYLGLIKQPENWSGTGYWLLTSWAWKLIRGEPIPKVASYWEGKLIRRSEITTTMPEMFKTHRELVEQAILKREAIRSNYTAKFADYDPKSWSDVGGYIQEFNEKIV